MALRKGRGKTSENPRTSVKPAQGLRQFKEDPLPYESEIVQEFVRRVYTVYSPTHILSPPDLILQAYEKASLQGVPISGLNDLICRVKLFSGIQISKSQVNCAIHFIRKKARLYSKRFNAPPIADIVKGQIVHSVECKKDVPAGGGIGHATPPTGQEMESLKPYREFFEMLDGYLAGIGNCDLLRKIVRTHLMALNRGIVIGSFEELVQNMQDSPQKEIRKARTKLNIYAENLFRQKATLGEAPYYFNLDVCLVEKTRAEVHKKMARTRIDIPVSMAVKNEEKLTLEQAIETATRMRIVIASHKTILEIYKNPATSEAMAMALRDAWPYWTGTMVAYESKGVKLGSAVEFMAPGSQIRYVFPTGDYEGEKNVVLAVNHPDFHIEKDGKNRIVHACNVGIVRNFPHMSGWYLLDDEFGLPYGENLSASSKGEAIGVAETKMVSLTAHSFTPGVLSFPIQTLSPLGRGGGLVKDDTKEWKPYDRI